MTSLMLLMFLVLLVLLVLLMTVSLVPPAMVMFMTTIITTTITIITTTTTMTTVIIILLCVAIITAPACLHEVPLLHHAAAIPHSIQDIGTELMVVPRAMMVRLARLWEQCDVAVWVVGIVAEHYMVVIHLHTQNVPSLKDSSCTGRRTERIQ